jgi:hypothetical protein
MDPPDTYPARKESTLKNRSILGVLVLAVFVVSIAVPADAARVRVKRGPRGRVTKVTVTRGFPLRRPLPAVVVRPGPVIRVAPRAYLAPVVFGAVVVASLPDPQQRVWTGSAELYQDEGWTDFTLDVDRRGDRMLIEIDRGSAQLSFAEVVFENGETQVVDFNDGVHRSGLYSLLNFADGRKVDHVRVVAKASSDEAELRLHLTS